MPLYEYKNSNNEIIERFFSMKDDKPEVIVENGIEYKRIFSVPMMAVVDSKKPKTVGAMADANTRKMEKEGKLQPKKQKESPWWRKGKKADKSLAKLSPKAAERYIMEGKK